MPIIFESQTNIFKLDTNSTSYVMQINKYKAINTTVENYTGFPMTLLHNEGKIGYLSMKRINVACDEVLAGHGYVLEKNV